MKIPLQNVSINYSDKLPRVNLVISKLIIDIDSNQAEVNYTHTLPLDLPSGESEVHLDSGTITVQLPPEFNTMVQNIMQTHINNSYGNVV